MPVRTRTATPACNDSEVLQLAASLEQYSEHPLALAVVARSRDVGASPLPATDFEATPGLGVRARIEGRMLFLGAPRFVTSHGVAIDENAVRQLALAGATVSDIAIESADNTLMRSVTNVLRTVPGVANAEVSLEKSEAKVTFDPAQANPDALRRAIEDAGYEAP